MALNRITPGGVARRAPFLVALCAVAITIAACGGGGSGSGTGGGESGGTATVAPEKAADAEVLNHVLDREMAAIEAYGRVLPLLSGRDLALARRFRAQEQEHVDAVLKGLRGLGARAEPEVEAIEREGLKSRADILDFLYEVESVSIEDGLRAISNLATPWPRSLLASIAANQAQHLVLLRQALGEAPLASVPEAFESGAAPVPSDPDPKPARTPPGKG